MSKIKDVLQIIMLVSVVMVLIGLLVYSSITVDLVWYVKCPLVSLGSSIVLIIAVKIYEASKEE